MSPYGDVLWRKLEAIQAGYETLGYIGKRQTLQRWEGTFEYEILKILAETGGHMEVNDEQKNHILYMVLINFSSPGILFFFVF